MWPGFGLTAQAARAQAKQAVSNWGQLGSWAAKAAWNTNAGKGAVLGAAAGGIYGGMSENNTFLGGATKGAIGGAMYSHYSSKFANRMQESSMKSQLDDIASTLVQGIKFSPAGKSGFRNTVLNSNLPKNPF